MDALSGAASIFAVISLAVQLAETAIRLKRFLDSIRDAPAEIRRLRSSIVLLIDINENINALLHRQTCQGEVNHRVVQSIYQSLEICADKLDIIHGTLHLASTAENANPVLRGWAQIRLACKKEQFEAFTDQLDIAINMLGVFLAVNLSHLQLTALSDITQLSERLTILSNNMLSEKVHGLSALAENPHSGPKQPPGSSPQLPLIHSKSSPGKIRQWQRGKSLQFLYCQVGGEHTRYSVSAIIQIYGSRVIQMQMTFPYLAKILLSPSLISLRSLIPQDAAILNACKSGDSTTVKQLFTSGKARPNDATLANRTALSTAIRHDQIEIVQLLLQAGADPNLPAERLQDSPIQIAVAQNNSQIARLLMRYGADLQYCSAGSWSILHHLFDRNKTSPKDEYYSMFRNHLMFDDIKDSSGFTALHRCAAFGTASDVYKLVELGASPLADSYVTTWGRSPLHVAALQNNVSTLEALADLSINDRNTHDGAAQQRAILETADINGWTPLHLAIYCKALNTAKWLLGKRVDVHKRTYSTAIWFPKDHTNEAFSVMDLANMAGDKILEEFSSLLVDVGYDIFTDGTDIYW